MVLQNIFTNERIISATELSPGYDDHASDVWHVKTDKREVIVRASGVGNIEQSSAFFRSLHFLFGIDPNNVFDMEDLSNTLSGFGAFTYPKVLEKHRFDREYAVVELLQGSTLYSFEDLSDDELRKFGRNLAKIHSHRLNYWGNPAGTFKISLDMVNNHIISSMRRIVDELYSDNRKIVNYLPKMEQLFSSLPAPQYTSYVLVDIDPSQYIVNSGIITGLVDTEAYVIAPRELDFIALEYVLSNKAADLVSEGYASVIPLPELSSVRTLYRYLYRLIEVQGDNDIDDWLSQPVLFA